jgi:hypothetical protein
MQEKKISIFKKISLIMIMAILLVTMLMLSAQWGGQAYAGQGTPVPQKTFEIPRTDNLIYNGNFEFGYYPVPELGFEPPDIGNIPHKWNWFKSNTYGKYDIDNNISFGVVCPDDNILKSGSRNSLSISMQSTDQPDARLGVYQTIDVVPGQDYLFSISGTIQAQPGSSSPDVNHHVQFVFDHTGGTNWQAIPLEEWALLPWREYDLEFKLSGPNDPDLARIESYYTIVKARSNKMTLFLGAWRRWPNWRMAVFTLDCVSLIPLNKVSNLPALLPQLSDLSTSSVNDALEAAILQTQPGTTTVKIITDTTQTTVTEQTTSAAGESSEAAPAQPAATPLAKPAEIPNSGGILDGKDNRLLLIVVAVVVIVGLTGAGVWNIRRRKG